MNKQNDLPTKNFMSLFVLMCVAMASVLSPHLEQAQAANLQPLAGPLPAPIANGLAPTLTFSPTHGIPGQVIDVSGEMPATQPGARVVWLLDNATFTAAEAKRDANNKYHAVITVPEQVQAGSAQICATVTGTAQARFSCADFVVDPAPAGAIEGTLPADALPLDGNVKFNVMDSAGNVLASAPVATNGQYTLNNLVPAIYQYAVVGRECRVLVF